MLELTKKQEAVRKFVENELKAGRPCPTHREIAERFKWSGPNAAAGHLKALVKKGVLMVEQGKVRALRLAEPFPGVPRPVTAEIPLYGSIPAGFSEDREQDPDGCVSVDLSVMDLKPSRHTFCLRVSGDSMIGKHICDGDIVILEHGHDPRNGEVVAALIDGKTTLKTFVQRGKKQFLQAENPKFPNLIPSEELVIQGVLKGLIRKGAR
jgi:repressor LexA